MKRWKCAGMAVALIVISASEEGWSAERDKANPEIRFLYRGVSGPLKTENLPYNNEGIQLEEGLNLHLRAKIAKTFDPLEITLEPLLEINSKSTGTIHKGYLRYKGNALNVDIGKQSLWWGPGAHGSLFLTNNASPLPMLRLFNAEPYRGGVFRALPLQFDLFVSRLEKERFVPAPYFQGTRIALQPHPQLTIGLTRMILMGGEGRPGMTPSRYWEIWFGENGEGNADLSNSLAGIDFNVMFPNVRFYGEWGGEDEAGFFPYHDAYLAGVSFPKGGMFGKGFTIEYTDMTDPVWYVHSLYPYTYKNRVLGHHVEGGGRDIYLEQTVFDEDHRYAKMIFDYEERQTSVTAYQMGMEGRFEAGRAVIPWTIQTDFMHEWVCADERSDECHREYIFSLSLIGAL